MQGVDLLPAVVDARNEPIFITANIENRAFTKRIGGWEENPRIGQTSP